MALLNQLYNPKVLSEVFLRNAPGNYIGRKIAPLYKSPVDRGIIDKVDVYSEVNRLKQLITAPGVAPNMLDIVVEKNLSYVCQKRATGIALPVEHRKISQSGAGINFYAQRGWLAGEALMVQYEYDVAFQINKVWKTDTSANAAYTSSPGTKWDNASGTPLADLAAKIGLITARGTRPDALAMDVSVLDGIVSTTEWKSRVQYDNTANLAAGTIDERKNILGKILGLPPQNIFVATNCWVNTAGKNATPTRSPIWSDNVFLGNVSPVVTEATQATICTPVWDGYDATSTSGASEGMAMWMWRDDAAQSDNLGVAMFYDLLGLNLVNGYWFTDVLT